MSKQFFSHVLLQYLINKVRPFYLLSFNVCCSLLFTSHWTYQLQQHWISCTPLFVNKRASTRKLCTSQRGTLKRTRTYCNLKNMPHQRRPDSRPLVPHSKRIKFDLSLVLQLPVTNLKRKQPCREKYSVEHKSDLHNGQETVQK